MRKSFKERFWSKVKKGKKSECWPWVGHVGWDGYGVMQSNGRKFRAHRAAYLLHHGTLNLPCTDIICHSRKCTTKLCCNPHHLRPNTDQQNKAECAAAGGYRKQAKRMATSTVLGIRDRLLAGDSQHQISRDTGITMKRINDIATGYRWSRLTGFGGSNVGQI